MLLEANATEATEQAVRTFNARGKLQKAFINAKGLEYTALAYPIKNGSWVDEFDPKDSSKGIYRVQLHSISEISTYGIIPIDQPRTVWGRFALALKDQGFVDYDGQLTEKGIGVLFHACYRLLPITVGEFCATIEATFEIEGED